MANTAVATSEHPEYGPDRVIDLRGHRLGDLVQVLSGCDPERAEMAVCEREPGTPVSPEAALDTLARALVQLRGPSAPAAG
jgi:hypothetical protein